MADVVSTEPAECAAGYRAPMHSVDEGVARYAERLISKPASSA